LAVARFASSSLPKPIRDTRRYGQLDLASDAGTAGDAQPSADLLRAFLHSGKAPTFIATGLDLAGIDATAIIANVEPQPLVEILELDFDVPRCGVPEGVD
jgi:hypothetical protein